MLGIPDYTWPDYSAIPNIGAQWRVRLVQAGEGRVEIAASESATNAVVNSLVLTESTGATRIRTRGQWSVAYIETVLKYGPATVWVVSGDVEAFS